jgi:hypothetical protein
VLSVVVLLIPGLLAIAGLIDLNDARRGRKQRDWAVICAERRDYEADMAATQHRGIAIPIGDICRDRQRGR